MQKNTNLIYPKTSYIIRGCCFELYKELGCGHKESVYQKGLKVKLEKKGLKLEREKRLPVTVDNIKVGTYVPDIVVDDKIMLELKAKSFVTKEDLKQFWHYLKITPYKLGFLINFGKPGGIEIKRRVYETARIS